MGRLSVPWYWSWLLLWAPATLLLGVAVWRLRHRLEPWLLNGPPPLLALTLFGIGIATMSLLNLPTGDEPHYLVMTQSLLRDGDFDLRNNYEQMQYLEYYPEAIPDPHVSIVGEHWYPVHGFGLAFLAAPWFSLAGRGGVVVMLSVVSALGIRVLWSALQGAGLGARTSSIATLTAALTLPFASLAGQIFPEAPAFLLVTVALWAILGPGQATWRTAGLALSVAVLPWLHAKYLLLAVALLVAGLIIDRARPGIARLAVAALAFVASAGGLAIVSNWFYGVPLPGAPIMMPSAPFGTDLGRTIATYFLVQPWVGLTGILLDQQSGLLVASPVFVLAAAGGILLVRRAPRIVVAGVAIVLSVYLPAGVFATWYGGLSSPARFLVPAVPLFALGVGAALQFGGRRALLAYLALAAPSFLYAYAVVTLPSFVRYGDPQTDRNYFIGLFERITHIDLTPLVPSFRNVTELTWITASVYVAVAVAITIWIVRVRARNASPEST